MIEKLYHNYYCAAWNFLLDKISSKPPTLAYPCDKNWHGDDWHSIKCSRDKMICPSAGQNFRLVSRNMTIPMHTSNSSTLHVQVCYHYPYYKVLVYVSIFLPRWEQDYLQQTSYWHRYSYHVHVYLLPIGVSMKSLIAMKINNWKFSFGIKTHSATINTHSAWSGFSITHNLKSECTHSSQSKQNGKWFQ